MRHLFIVQIVLFMILLVFWNIFRCKRLKKETEEREKERGKKETLIKWRKEAREGREKKKRVSENRGRDERRDERF